MASQFHDYTPYGVFTNVTVGSRADVTFVCGADNITLRLPEFGNSEAVDVARVFNTSRGGTPNVKKLNLDATEITVSFSVLTRTQGLALLDFLKNCIGLLVTYTDPDNRAWEGVITNPNSAVVDEGDCRYSAEIILSSASAV